MEPVVGESRTTHIERFCKIGWGITSELCRSFCHAGVARATRRDESGRKARATDRRPYYYAIAWLSLPRTNYGAPEIIHSQPVQYNTPCVINYTYREPVRRYSVPATTGRAHYTPCTDIFPQRRAINVNDWRNRYKADDRYYSKLLINLSVLMQITVCGWLPRQSVSLYSSYCIGDLGFLHFWVSCSLN